MAAFIRRLRRFLWCGNGRDAIANRVWNWLLDPNHVLEGLITRDINKKAVTIAHVRACPQPLGGYNIGFLTTCSYRRKRVVVAPPTLCLPL